MKEQKFLLDFFTQDDLHYILPIRVFHAEGEDITEGAVHKQLGRGRTQFANYGMLCDRLADSKLVAVVKSADLRFRPWDPIRVATVMHKNIKADVDWKARLSEACGMYHASAQLRGGVVENPAAEVRRNIHFFRLREYLDFISQHKHQLEGYAHMYSGKLLRNDEGLTEISQFFRSIGSYVGSAQVRVLLTTDVPTATQEKYDGTFFRRLPRVVEVVADACASMTIKDIDNDKAAQDRLMNAVRRVNEAGMGFQARVAPDGSDVGFVHVIGVAHMGNWKALYAGFGKLFELLQEDENAQ